MLRYTSLGVAAGIGREIGIATLDRNSGQVNLLRVSLALVLHSRPFKVLVCTRADLRLSDLR